MHVHAPQTLNAVVAADPAKQRWVVASGMLSLLQRLVARPPDPHTLHAPTSRKQQQQQQAWQSGMQAYDARLSSVAGGRGARVQPQTLQEVPQLCLRRQVQSCVHGCVCVCVCVCVQLPVCVCACLYVCMCARKCAAARQTCTCM